MSSKDTYFDDLIEPKQSRHSAKVRGQTFNALIRQYNYNVLNPKNAERTILDSVPSQLEGFSGEVHIGKRCADCGEIDCVPVEHRTLCVPCWKSAGLKTAMLGTDNWIYDVGVCDGLYDRNEFDEETELLLESLSVDVDLDQLHADEPLY